MFAIHLERQSLNAGIARRVAPSAHSERGIINERAAGARKNRKSSVRMPRGGGEISVLSHILPLYSIPHLSPSPCPSPTPLPCRLLVFPFVLPCLTPPLSSISPTLFTLSPLPFPHLFSSSLPLLSSPHRFADPHPLPLSPPAKQSDVRLVYPPPRGNPCYVGNVNGNVRLGNFVRQPG